MLQALCHFQMCQSQIRDWNEIDDHNQQQQNAKLYAQCNTTIAKTNMFLYSKALYWIQTHLLNIYPTF